MGKYILIYKYNKDGEEFTLESNDVNYLRHKISEYSSLSEKDIIYKILEVIEIGIEEYQDID